MPNIYVTDLNGEESPVEFTPGITLMQAICEADFEELLALCGGVCACATCHVYVNAADDSLLSKASEDELMMLDAANQRSENSRLACQIRLSDEHDNLRLSIAPAD